MHLVLNGMRRSTGGEKGKEPDTAPDNMVGLGVENLKGQGKGKAMGIHRNVSLKKKTTYKIVGMVKKVYITRVSRKITDRPRLEVFG